MPIEWSVRPRGLHMLITPIAGVIPVNNQGNPTHVNCIPCVLYRPREGYSACTLGIFRVNWYTTMRLVVVQSNFLKLLVSRLS